MHSPIEQLELLTHTACSRLHTEVDVSWIQQLRELTRKDKLAMIPWLMCDLIVVAPDTWIDLMMLHVGSCAISGPSYERWVHIFQATRRQLTAIHPYSSTTTLNVDDPQDPIWCFLGRLEQIRADLTPDPVTGDRESLRGAVTEHMYELRYMQMEKDDDEIVHMYSRSRLYLAWAYELGLHKIISDPIRVDLPCRWNEFLDRVAARYCETEAVRIIVCSVRKILECACPYTISVVSGSCVSNAIVCVELI